MENLKSKRMLNLKSLAFFGIISFALVAASCSKEEIVPEENMEANETEFKSDRAVPPGNEPIAAIAIDDGGFSELVQALTYVDAELDAGLVDLFLNGTDQFTVFAPTDDAFFQLYRALGEDVNDIDDLPATVVLDVLLYHVTEGRRTDYTIVPKKGTRTIQTLLGQSFTVDPEEVITAFGSTAYIDTPNISASNGVIHIIDNLLIPDLN